MMTWLSHVETNIQLQKLGGFIIIIIIIIIKVSPIWLRYNQE